MTNVSCEQVREARRSQERSDIHKFWLTETLRNFSDSLEGCVLTAGLSYPSIYIIIYIIFQVSCGVIYNLFLSHMFTSVFIIGSNHDCRMFWRDLVLFLANSNVGNEIQLQLVYCLLSMLPCIYNKITVLSSPGWVLVAQIILAPLPFLLFPSPNKQWP